jgi:hypothetical protein
MMPSLQLPSPPMQAHAIRRRIDHPRGQQNPLRDDQVIAKFRDLVAPVISAETSRRIIDTVLTIEHCDDVGVLHTLL